MSEKMPGTAFSWPARVYYEDTDAIGVVYYANYLCFFERARTEWLRQAGVNQRLLAEQSGVQFVVRNAAVDYLAPGMLDDELKLTVAVERLSRSTVTFLQHAWRITPDGRPPLLLATARVVIVCVSVVALKPKALPPEMVERLQDILIAN